MSEENTTPPEKVFIDPNTDNLDDFQKLFDGTASPMEETPENSEDLLSGEEDTEITEESVEEVEVEESDGTEEVIGEEGDDEEIGEDDTPAPKKNSFQDRIDELTAKRRDAEREAEQLRERLDRIENQMKEKEPPAKEEVKSSDGSLDPDALDDKGELIYPLGDMDPKFIRDVTRNEYKQMREQEKAQEAHTAQQAAISANWQTKVAKAKESIPDLEEKTQKLGEHFQGIDPQYGEFLATTIMQMDKGPEMLYYLADHPDEADMIVGSGPLKAAMALGRLEAQMATTSAPAPKRVSKAPEPPLTRTRGKSGSTVPPADTDDLDAFIKHHWSN
jgi:hypothetical protein